jgi:Predicted acyl-CoA transferases/carnitine dehydratase
MREADTSLPLGHITVIDTTRVLSGPFAAMILADMGANVIKIERPGTGDDSRGYGPFFKDESGYFMNVNRNKKSICVDLKKPRGKEVFLKLAKDADVILENFRPGTMDKMGLGYETLKAINPRLIFASISGFGNNGPYSKRAAYDIIIQAMSGLMSVTGEKDGEPVRVGVSVADLVAALYAVIGILTAIENRNKTGKGQSVDVAMLDCQVSFLENAVARYFATGVDPKPLGNRHPSIIPFEAFQTADSSMVIAVGNDAMWADFCHCAGCPQMADDPRFVTNRLRGDNHDEMKALLDKVFATKTTSEWISLLDAAGIPCSQINQVHDIVAHPQLAARDMFVDVQHPIAGKTTLVGIPIKMGSTPGSIRAPAPTLGQHGHEILKGLGYSESDIRAMDESGAIKLGA